MSLEVDYPGREVRWLEAETDQSWLLNLDGREVARLDRREGQAASILNLDFTDTVAVWGGNGMGGQGWAEGWSSPSLGSCLALHPTLPLLSLCQGHTVAVYDLRQPDRPLHTAQHCLQYDGPRARCFSGCSWSPSGALLLGCQTSGPSQTAAVWRFSQAAGILSEPSLQWPGAGGKRYSGANFQRGQGAVWAPWGDRDGREVVVTPASLQTGAQSSGANCVVALDVARWVAGGNCGVSWSNLGWVELTFAMMTNTISTALS